MRQCHAPRALLSAGVRARGVSLNPGRRHLEAGQTAIVVASSQAAVDAALHQRFSWPTSLPVTAPAEAPAEVSAPSVVACTGRGVPPRGCQAALKVMWMGPT